MQLIYFYALFLTIFSNFQNEADCLSVKSLINPNPMWLFFNIMVYFQVFTVKPKSNLKIDAMVTFLWFIERIYFFYSLSIVLLSDAFPMELWRHD